MATEGWGGEEKGLSGRPEDEGSRSAKASSSVVKIREEAFCPPPSYRFTSPALRQITSSRHLLLPWARHQPRAGLLVEPRRAVRPQILTSPASHFRRRRWRTRRRKRSQPADGRPDNKVRRQTIVSVETGACRAGQHSVYFVAMEGQKGKLAMPPSRGKSGREPAAFPFISPALSLLLLAVRHGAALLRERGLGFRLRRSPFSSRGGPRAPGWGRGSTCGLAACGDLRSRRALVAAGSRGFSLLGIARFQSLPGTARQLGLAPASRCTLLTMVAPYISNIAPWEEFITTFGPAKDNALPLVGGIKVGYSSERRTEGCLVAKMWILVYALRLPGLITMKCASMASQAMPQRSNPL
ncbi:hypothetical protein ABZP36_012651 [Zizania latifolia]